MKLEIDIRTILNGTATYLVGQDISNYRSVIIGDFEVLGKKYTVNAVFDLETEVQQPVITDENDIIINEITKD